MYIIAVLFAILGTSQSQLLGNSSCDFLSLVYYQGESHTTGLENYYEIRRINNTWNTGQCASWQFTTRNNNIHISSKEVISRKLIERNATANPNIDGSLKVIFRDFSSNFTLLGIGKDFAVLYACSKQGKNKQEYTWVLGRTTTLSTSASIVVQNILKNNKLSNASWVETSHSKESCKTGGANNLKMSPIIVLIVGFVISKRI